MMRASAFSGLLTVLSMSTAWPAGEPASAPVQKRTISLDEMLWGTRLCMREAVRTQLVQGVRESADIITFTLSVCGDGLSAFMQKNLQRPAAEALIFVEGMAYEELDRFPGIVRTGPLPPNRQLGFSDSYTVTTFKNKQSIDVRKTDVPELLSAGTAMTNAFRKAPPSQDQMASAARDMAEKDRCFKLHGAMVALASIEAGTLEAPQGVKELLRSSISSIEAANSQSQIVCEMR